jgi:ribosomal protein S18 acetylase RimI-like enzyme
MARRFRSLTAERVDELPRVCGQCALWELGAEEPACGSSHDRDTLIEWIRTVRSEWGDCGRMVYDGGEMLGFVKYAPPRYFPQVAFMPSGPPDDDSVLIACLHVEEEARHAGLGKALLQAALRDLAMRGEKVVEAYAAADPVDRARVPLMSVEFLLRQGFIVARPHPRYPRMRLELKALAAWTDNVEAVLEALQAPLRVRERIPAPGPVPR